MGFGKPETTAALTPAELTARARAHSLARAVRRLRYPRHLVYLGHAEQSFTAIHDATGLAVKVRPDLLLHSPKRTRLTVIDFKTTSCRDRDQFLTTIEPYDYDRQGAFYADVLGAGRVVLIAVQKKTTANQPPTIWVHELTPDQLAIGRKKYARLLREAAGQTASVDPRGKPEVSCGGGRGAQPAFHHPMQRRV